MPELPTTPSTDAPGSAPQSYEEFLEDIKGRIRSAQARAAKAINTELIGVYWQIGREIVQRQQEEGPELGRHTRGVVQRLSADLRAAFPGARGFSVPNLYRMRAFAAAWPDSEGLSDRVRDLPWGHIATLVAVTEPSVGAWSSRSPSSPHAARTNWRRTTDRVDVGDLEPGGRASMGPTMKLETHCQIAFPVVFQ